MYVCCLRVCVFLLCIWCHRGQKMVLGPLEVNFEVVVSHFVGAGNRTGVLCKSSKCSELSHLSTPSLVVTSALSLPT